MTQEKWVSLWGVVKYGELYEVSENGRVRNIKTGRVLKSCKGNHGYFVVVLSDDGNSKSYLVHRLLMLAFRPSQEGKDFVNHINGVKTDNALTNLEWVTMTENNRHAWEMGLMDREKHRIAVAANGRKTGPKSIKYAQEANKKRVSLYSLENELIGEYESVVEASLKTGIPRTTISRSCLSLDAKPLRFNECYFRFSTAS